MPAQDPNHDFIVADDNDGAAGLNSGQASDSSSSSSDSSNSPQNLDPQNMVGDPQDMVNDLQKEDQSGVQLEPAQAIVMGTSSADTKAPDQAQPPLSPGEKATDQPLQNDSFVVEPPSEDSNQGSDPKESSSQEHEIKFLSNSDDNSDDNSQNSQANVAQDNQNSNSSSAQNQTQANNQSQASAKVQPKTPVKKNSDNTLFDSDQPKIATSFSGLLGVLVENRVLTEEQAQEINSVQLATNKELEDILKESDLVSELNLVKAKAEMNQVPFVPINDTGVAPEALSVIDESVARRYTALPFALDQEEKKIRLAMADPLNISAISFIEQKTGLKVEAYYATPSELKRLISERYAQDLSSDVTAALEETKTIKPGDLELLQGQQGGFVKAAPINKIVNTVLDYALQSRASDVHIEPMAAKTRVRYRIDGILQEKLILPRTVHDAVVSRVKILSDLKIDEKRVPQDGRFDYSVAGQEVDLRVSTMPSVHGEKVVMRLLMKNQSVPGLEELGMRGLALQHVNKAIRIPHGIFLVTGPTGSGKTTSLYSILNNINTPKVNIMTLEDPVEYQMPGITQVQVRPQAGLTFANGLRSFLRQDPDIIMVGEIRDTETAELAVQASLTGHLVFATLHTNSAAGALPRLVDMKVEPFLLSSSMVLVMGQRVVRKINVEYKEEYQPDAEVVADIKRVLGDNFDAWCKENDKDPQNVTLYRPKKDRPQTEPEYKGRTGIFEVLNITDEIKSLINKRAPAGEINDVAMKNGMMLMKQDGYIKALEGITTIEEVLRVAEVK